MSKLHNYIFPTELLQYQQKKKRKRTQSKGINFRLECGKCFFEGNRLRHSKGESEWGMRKRERANGDAHIKKSISRNDTCVEFAMYENAKLSTAFAMKIFLRVRTTDGAELNTLNGEKASGKIDARASKHKQKKELSQLFLLAFHFFF